ncbi:transcription-repair coupling factor [Tissierellia bacterium KA00581]|nr:transcription-repair coupling factor [Tissierellia bacterium KA00581]
MNFLIDFFKNNDSYKSLISNLKLKNTPIQCSGLVKTSIFHLLYSIFIDANRSCLVVIVENENRVNELYEELKNILDNVVVYPNYDIRFHNINSLESNLENKRIEVINRLVKKEKLLIITTAAAISKKISTPKFFKSHCIQIGIDDNIDMADLTEKLTKMHYDRVDFVESKGQFSVRGSIFDIFPVDYENPIRIEFFSDEIDSIRTFEINTQRSKEKLENVNIIPAKEMVLSKDDVKNILSGLTKDIEKLKKLTLFGKNIDNSLEKFYKIYNDLKINYHISNMDLLSPYIKRGSFSTILDYLQKDAVICTEDILKIYDKNLETEHLFYENITDLIENGEILDSHKNILVPFEKTLNRIKKFDIINLTMLLKRTKIINAKVSVNIKTLEAECFNRKFDYLFKTLKFKLQRGYKIVIFAGSKEMMESFKNILSDENINFICKDNLDFELKSSILVLSNLNFNCGFEIPEQKILFLTHKEIYGFSKKVNKKLKVKKSNLLSYTDLNIGDYVVHENHGIGQYRGIEQIEVNGIIKDHILIMYKDNDRLYIPTDQMNLIQKYIGKDGYRPKLNRLGSSDWIKTKQRAKKALDEIATDLVKLYAKRDKIEGFSFSYDTPWQREFEDSFIYEETYSQLRAIDEIKKDMESKKPMDRLLCGDVGYGKTEVALRAAFKAIMDNKQVAFLVPTTILAKQHYETALERFGTFPIDIEMLSRFKTQSEQKEIIKNLKNGKINLLIGTHKLLSKNLDFKDLGLLIIDEEQRFGVKHKEALKQMKENIDVLSLSATPIPRTMQMSLVGIRDMSILDDPPEERVSISTFVLEYNDSVIKEAIYKEIDRGGQVYFVYNRIKDMDKMYKNLSKLLPDVKIAIAHSKLTNRELENIMEAFQEGEYDILLSTTIIETGMDIKNCNTMIIYDADKMGLSQLYQLKGRIGRSERRAFAYFTYEKNKSISEISEKRLMAIRDFSEFGSGFKIAMRDLELRGAGNILGECQSGHVETIGYELYVRMLEESIREVKGEKLNLKEQTQIELSVDAYIPSNYITDNNQKIDMYNKIARIESREDLNEIFEELIDRFGDVPKVVVNVMNVSYLKSISTKLNFSKISERNKSVVFKFDKDDKTILELVSKLEDSLFAKLEFNLNEDAKLIFNYDKNKLVESINLLEKFLEIKEKLKLN